MAPAIATAVPMTWNYSGTCTSGDCDIIDSITGTLSGDPEIIPPSDELQQLLVGELSSYSFQVGPYSFSGDGGLDGAAGSYDLDGSGNIVGGSMSFSNGIFDFEFLTVNVFNWSFSDTNIFGEDYSARGVGSYSLATAVPEPAAVSLLGAGLLALGLGWRRRRSA